MTYVVDLLAKCKKNSEQNIYPCTCKQPPELQNSLSPKKIRIQYATKKQKKCIGVSSIYIYIALQ